MRHTPKDASYSLRLPSETLEKLREIEDRVGVPVAEQIRRGVALWLQSQALVDRALAVTTKGKR